MILQGRTDSCSFSGSSLGVYEVGRLPSLGKQHLAPIPDHAATALFETVMDSLALKWLDLG